MTDSSQDLEQVLGVLISLASGDYSARGVPSGADETYEALMLGVNMMAEELEASLGELEARVQERTDELRQLNDQIMALAELAYQLQSCATSAEALEVIPTAFRAIFASISGALYVRSRDEATLDRLTAWGPHAPTELSVCRNQCRALRPDGSRDGSEAEQVADCAHCSDPPGVTAGNGICIPVAADGRVFGLLRLVDVRPTSGMDGRGGGSLHQLATTAADHVAVALVGLELREVLRAQATRDSLTGLYNRRFMEEWAQGELSRTDRAEASLGVIVVDIDRFKKVNDEHGHDGGDHVIQAVATALRTSLRPEDIACRYGGEEFVLLLSCIDGVALATRAETVRAYVSALHMEHAGVQLPQVTVSAGYALYPQHGPSFEQVLTAADEALYRAKRTGRNRALPAS